jgi:hypothetical protein
VLLLVAQHRLLLLHLHLRLLLRMVLVVLCVSGVVRCSGDGNVPPF